ncbi:hypothetical protein ACFFIF_02440 [Vagococcus entomophilus]|uniref:hypothetical protein n=1 Tax=Vagococcus entomophilus TaxID=1160095 RepID=UPI001FECE304|nr:hypothetical protein [Vagococcus entomophilus]
MQEKEMQASTINVSISRLKKLFDYMLIEKYIEYNPFVDIERLKEERKVINPLNDCEIKQMLTVAIKNTHTNI